MIRNTDILIQRLKRQPVQGMATDPNEEVIKKNEAAQKVLSENLENIKKSADKAFTAIADSYMNVVDAFNTGNLSLGTGIGKLAGVFDSYATAMTDVVKQATFLEQRNATLNKSFGINSLKAAELGQQYDSLADTLGVGGEKIRKYATNIDKFLPGMSKMIAGNAKLNAQLLGTNQLLTEHMSDMEQAAEGYQMYAAGVGKNSVELLAATSKIADAFDANTGYSGTFKNVIKEIGNLSADLQMTYGKMPGALEKSVMKARLLGTTFAKIEAMATKMLSIEESVGQELEYQLLSGKRLVNQQGESITENLRIAKLSGNAEDQVKAMNDLLKSQGDIIDGNNYYAKQQLESLTGFTVAELTRQRQLQKLQEQAGMDQAAIDRFMNMDPGSFEAALKDVKDESTKLLLNELKANQGEKTTDQKFADFLDMKRTVSVTVMAPNQVTAITGAKEDVEKGQGAAAAYGQQFMTKAGAESLGKTQLLGNLFDATKKPIDTLITMLPLVNGGLQTLSDRISSLKTTLAGNKGTTGRTGPDDTTTETVPDGILVNDAMIQFHPADKFATVSDGAALLASTERGKLDSAVDSLMGRGGSGTAVVDPAPIAAAIMSALASMKVEVNYDVVAAQKAIGFKFNQSIN